MFKALSFFLFLFLCSGISAFGNPLLELEQSTLKKEQAVPGIKARTTAFFQWANPQNPQKTPFVFVYFHGFSASPKESSPLVEHLAAATNSNAYFPRWKGHGIQGREGLRNVRLADWQTDTQEFLRTAKLLGERVIPVAMSMGAGVLLPTIPQENFPAVILLSPNFKVHRWDSEFLRIPYLGTWLAKLLVGEYREWQARNPEHEYHWTTAYPVEIVAEVVKSAALARETPLESIQTPLFLAYSEKDTVSNHHQMLKAFQRWGSTKKILLHANGNNDSHNLAGDILSKDYTDTLKNQILQFLSKEAGIK
jgi:alpha-beta hydrolase superfamily lysophospholipase